MRPMWASLAPAPLGLSRSVSAPSWACWSRRQCSEWKLQALVLDRKSTVGIVEHRDALAGEGPCDRVRLEDEQHVVILQRQAVRDRAVLLPGKRLIELVVLAHRPVQVLVRARLLANAPMVVPHERRRALVACFDRRDAGQPHLLHEPVL